MWGFIQRHLPRWLLRDRAREAARIDAARKLMETAQKIKEHLETAQQSSGRLEPTLSQPKQPTMRIQAHHVAAVRGLGVTVADPFKLHKPPPGTLPDKDVGMANDEDVSAMTGYTREADRLVGEGLVFPGYTYLAQLAQRPEYRLVAETYAKEMTRRWITVYGTGDEDKTDRVKQIGAELKRLKVRDVFREAAEIDGLFGRASIYIDTDDRGTPEISMPLSANKEKVQRNTIRRLKAVEPLWSYPAGYNARSPLSPDFYRPTHWYVQSERVHRTRLLNLVTREVPDLLKPAYMFGGLSLSQMIEPYVENWLRTRQSVSDLIQSCSVPVLKTDLSSLTTGVSNAALGSDLVSRIQLFNATRNNRGLFLLNKDTEEFDNVTASMGTLDKLQAQSQEHIASVAGIPLVKLLGVTPSGLNASSDGEMRAFYDRITAVQEHAFREPLSYIIRLIQVSLWGEIDPDIDFKFEPLWETSDSEKATIRKTNADTDGSLIDKGIIAPEEARKRLANEEGGVYQGLDPNDLPTPPPQEAPGGEAPPGQEDDVPPAPGGAPAPGAAPVAPPAKPAQQAPVAPKVPTVPVQKV